MPGSASRLAVLRALVDGLPAMLAYWDAHLRCRFANRAYLTWFGVDPDTMIGRDMAEFLGPLFELNRRYIEGALRGEPQCFERAIPDPRGGPPRESEALYVPDRDPDDGAVRGFCVLVTDITARKQRERELRAAQQELARERDVLEHFFTLSVDLMCIVQRDGAFLRLSPGFEAFGDAEGALRARPLLALVHPDDLATTRAALESSTVGGEPARFECRLRRRDGTYRWLAWSAAIDADGLRYLIARDVTEARRAHDALVRAKEEAEAATRELEAFSYSVAHDLRSPLRAIDGYSQAVLDELGDRLPPGSQQDLRRVRHSAQAMASQIDELLALSRIMRADLVRARVDLSHLVRGAIARLSRAQPARAVQVEISSGVFVVGDPRMLGLLIDHLIGNAWKFTRPRAGARIAFGVVETPRGRAMFVRDNGVGFDMAFADKLFGVFQRLHAPGEFEGVGIGLATAHRVVTRHQGALWAESAPGEGAVFYFTLPDAP